jgi:hypothetical protein
MHAASAYADSSGLLLCLSPILLLQRIASVADVAAYGASDTADSDDEDDEEEARAKRRQAEEDVTPLQCFM